MDFTSELLARLQKGESIDSLAAELTKAINDARIEDERIKAEQEAKRKAEAEAKRKAKRQAEIKARDKHDAIETLRCAIEKIIVAWNLGDDMLDFVDGIKADELVQEFDEVVPAAKAYVELVKKLGTRHETPTGDRSMKTAPDLPAIDDPIEDFLNKFVR